MNFKNNIFIKFLILLIIYLFFNIVIILQGFIGINLIRIQFIELIIFGFALIGGFRLLFTSKIYITSNKTLIIYPLIFLLYTIFSIVLLFRFNYQTIYILYVFYYILFFYFINFSLNFNYSAQQYKIDDSFFNVFSKFFGISGIVMFFVAFLQFILKDTIFALTGEGGKDLFVKSELLGTFRPPALFRSSYEYGIMSTINLSLSFARYLKKDRKSLNVLILVFSIAGVLISQTRNIYFYASMSMVNIYLIHFYFSKLKNTIKYVPFYYALALHVLLIVLALVALNGLNSGGFSDTASTIVRYTYFIRLYESVISQSNLLDYLFGWGLIQHSGDSALISIFPDIFNDDDGTLGFDNLFLSIFMFSGLIGLLIYLAMYFKFWTSLLNIIKNNDNAFILGFTGFFGAYLGAGVFNLINIGGWSVLTWFTASVILLKYNKLNE